MEERRETVGERAVVIDDGRRYEPGTRVRIERAPSEPGQLRLVADSRGDREVLTCRRVVVANRAMLVVTLRRV